jgi:DNA-binding CsgD family transcriptional regulator
MEGRLRRNIGRPPRVQVPRGHRFEPLIRVFPELAWFPMSSIAMASVPPRRLRLALASIEAPTEQPMPPERAAAVIPLPFNRRRESGLSEREQQVLELTAQGLTNAEIGRKLFVSEETVKSHLRHLLAKLQARNRAHLVALGFRQGLIALAPSPPPSAS